MALLAAWASGCGLPKQQAGGDIQGDTISLHYARLLQLIDCDSFTVVDVKNPWGRGLLQRYLLVPREAPVPRNLPHGTVLRTPLDNMLVFSTVHAHLLHTLDASAAIGGVCDSRYMLSPFVREGVARGGEGNGNPLQYSCLEKSMDRGAWWATVYRVTKRHD